MDQIDIEIFRINCRLALIERLTIKTAFAAVRAEGSLTTAAVSMALKEWFDASSESADQSYGPLLKDPALTALYTDEARTITNNLKQIVDEVFLEAKKAFED